jgi:NitT/TauT family transport system substrate-binding protein
MYSGGGIGWGLPANQRAGVDTNRSFTFGQPHVIKPSVKPYLLTILLALAAGCGKQSTPAPAAAPAPADTPIKLLLDWRPEPEFGGFYAANLDGGPFAGQHLNVSIVSAGEGAPTWQLLAAGQADFATTAADQVLIARSQNADVVALFTVYQTCPQGVMVHKARHFSGLADVFQNPGTLAAEDNAWLHYCTAKYAPVKVTITGYAGGFAPFLAQADYSQQCFITSEPILAARQGGDPQTFLIADSGFNPYTTVVIARGDTVRNHPDLVKQMALACRQGWRNYLDDPSAANAAMEKLNTDMDPQTFTDAAAAQKPLIDLETGLGTMNLQRWQDLRQQLIALNILNIANAPAADSCFVNP